jgi:hypothetical protein
METTPSDGQFLLRTPEVILAEKEGLDVHVVDEMAKNDRERFIALLDKHNMRKHVTAEDLKIEL